VKEIRAIFDKGTKQLKTEACIYWVLDGSPTAEVRPLNPLFESEDPSVAPGGFLVDLAPNNKTIWPNQRPGRTQLQIDTLFGTLYR
jgi:hypothetical protein